VTWWLQGSSSDGSAPIAAIFRPAGDGPFPVVVYLHAAEGMTPDQLSLGPTLSAAGFIAVIGCHTTARALVSCKQTPADPVGALIDLAKRLPGARSGPIGLAGCSIGGAAAFALGAGRDDIAAIVVDSTAGFVEATPKAPVLLLTSNQDNSLVVADAHRYDAMFHDRGVTVETKYYDNGGHMVMFSAAIRDDARQRAVSFLTKYLKP
jgi:dienelactone hydrolase